MVESVTRCLTFSATGHTCNWANNEIVRNRKCEIIFITSHPHHQSVNVSRSSLGVISSYYMTQTLWGTGRTINGSMVDFGLGSGEWALQMEGLITHEHRRTQTKNGGWVGGGHAEFIVLVGGWGGCRVDWNLCWSRPKQDETSSRTNLP